MKYTTETWIKKAKEIHGDTIIYDKVIYNGSHEKVQLKCAICGHEFWQEAREHLNGSGCRKCAMKRVGEYNHNVRKHNLGNLSTEEFVNRSKKIHGNDIDYSEVDYKNMNTKVCLICNQCGNKFWQTPRHHLHRGHGCPKCNGGVSDTESDFLEKIKKLYGDKYDYSKVKYVKSNKKVCIICHNKSKNGLEHGEFMMTPNALLSGHGCPSCNQSFSEEEIKDFLTSNNIDFIRQKTFEWLINPETKRKMRIDFYLPSYNVAIECQGIQHFEPTDFGGFGEEWAIESFIKNKQRDEKKKKLCEEHNIRMIYFSNVNNSVCNNKEKLLKLIENE